MWGAVVVLGTPSSRDEVRLAVPGADNWSAAYPASIVIQKCTSGTSCRSDKITFKPLESAARCNLGSFKSGGVPVSGGFERSAPFDAVLYSGNGYTSSA